MLDRYDILVCGPMVGQYDEMAPSTNFRPRPLTYPLQGYTLHIAQ